jgi:superfamily II DNA or RNA helicase
MDLGEAFTFWVDGYKFTPAYKNKFWDGKIRLFNVRTGELPFGLVSKALRICKERGYTVEISEELIPPPSPSEIEILKFIATLDLRAGGLKIEPRDYQIEAVTKAIQDGRKIIVSPTGSGKSLIIYIFLRWFLAQSESSAMVVVPTTSLVEQMSKDFADYSSHDDDFDANEEVHGIYSGKERETKSRVVVTTWQTAIKCPRDWFLKFDCVIGDEAHNFKAKSLTTIMNNCVNAHYRIGTTGTLDGSTCNELVLIGLFGPVYKVISTKDLIENETLANLKIKCIVLNHGDEISKVVSRMDYKSEISTIVEHPTRNQFIKNLALDQKGNTLVLFNFVHKHGKPLHKLIEAEAAEDRQVFYVSGEVKTEDRELIRELTEQESNAIIVASTACFSTGINIKSLNNIIFAAPNKSQIRVLQSIGRGLRRSKDGRGTTVYDIADNFQWRKRKNYTLSHGVERVKIYAKEGFDYKIIEVPMSTPNI